MDHELAERFARLWQAGAKLKEVAEALGISFHSAAQLRRRLGLPPRKRRVPEGALRELRKLYEAGLPLKEIARKLGIGYTTVRRLREELGLPPRRRAVAAEVRRLSELGLSAKEIAERLGVSRSTVYKHLRRRRWELRHLDGVAYAVTQRYDRLMRLLVEVERLPKLDLPRMAYCLLELPLLLRSHGIDASRAADAVAEALRDAEWHVKRLRFLEWDIAGDWDAREHLRASLSCLRRAALGVREPVRAELKRALLRELRIVGIERPEPSNA